MTETLNGDLDFVHPATSDVVLETQPLALLSLAARAPKRIHQLIAFQGVEGLFKGLKVVGAEGRQGFVSSTREPSAALHRPPTAPPERGDRLDPRAG